MAWTFIFYEIFQMRPERDQPQIRSHVSGHQEPMTRNLGAQGCLRTACSATGATEEEQPVRGGLDPYQIRLISLLTSTRVGSVPLLIRSTRLLIALRPSMRRVLSSRVSVTNIA